MQPTAQQIKQMYPGYAGWNDEAAIVADYLATGGQGKGNNPYALGGNNAPQPVSQPATTQSFNQAQTVSAPQQQGGQPTSAQDLINMGYYGYQGWGDAEALADFRATGGQGKGGPSQAGSGAGNLNQLLSSQPTINLPEIYSSLYQSSGIDEKTKRLAELERKYLEARRELTDNPFASASMIDKRLARLQQKYDEETAPLRNEIAKAQADIETRLNLQTQQFNIDSQQAQQSLNIFNSLLSSGALDNASGQDIANITRATGLPSSVVESAINANKKKNQNIAVQTFTAENGEVFSVAIDQNTGEMINKTSLGIIGNVQTGSGGGMSVTQQREADYQQTRKNLIGDIQRGAILRELVGHYGAGVDVAEIYRLYNSYSPYGQAEESLEQVKEGRFIA